jgi:hypothetical protein
MKAFWLNKPKSWEFFGLLNQKASLKSLHVNAPLHKVEHVDSQPALHDVTQLIRA